MDVEISGVGNFYYRVSCVIYNQKKDRILVVFMKDRDYQVLPGGKVKFQEKSEEAISREIKEEIGLELDYHFLYLSEYFGEVRGIKRHQICITYEAVYRGNSADEIKSLEGDFNAYRWVKIEDLERLQLKPRLSREMLLREKKHFVVNE